MLARRLAVYVVCVLGVTVGFALGAGSALAGVVHPPVGSFGSEGTGAGSFNNVQSIAVEESSGDVFVYDAVTTSIYKYTASGEPAEFSALKSNAIPNVGGAAFETQIAVDSSGTSTTGDIYIANAQTVEIYGSDGKYLGEFSSKSLGEGEPCGVAVDPAGNVYVGLYPNDVKKYTPSGNPVTNSDYVSTLYTGDGLCNIAVDSSGNAYTTSWAGSGIGYVRKYQASDFNTVGMGSLGQIIEPGFNVAADRVSSDAYVDGGSQVTEYDSAVNKVGVTSGVSGSNAVGVDGTTGELYVADASSGRVKIFGPPEIVPDVAIEEPSELQTTSATLKGTVNPSGAQVTSCQFEYWIGTRYGQVAPCEQQPGSGTAPVSVTAKVSGLSESTEYRYQLKAANERHSNASEEAAFATHGRPTLRNPETRGATRTSTRLEAEINPHGYDTTYRFEYGTDTKYGTSIPVPDGDVGAGDSYTQVMGEPVALEQGAVYHYRLVATNAQGTAYLEDHTFTTEPAARIALQWASAIGNEAAQIHAKISPRGLETTYRFEYGTDTKYGTIVPAPDGTIGAQYGENAATVTEPLEGLAPGTTYHFRVSATNANGADAGSDVSFTTLALPRQERDGCPNGRVALSVGLPDCRAYELVSPPSKGPANVATEPSLTQSSAGGDAIKYDSTGVFGAAQGVGVRGDEYVSQRGTNAWTTMDIEPFQAGMPIGVLSPQGYVNFSEDLSKGVYMAGSPVLPGYPNSEKVRNLYLRANVLSGALADYALLTDASTPLPRQSVVAPYEAAFAGASTDYSRILFETTRDLTPETENLNRETPKVYEWENGTVRLESILPEGAPAPEALAGGGAGGGASQNGNLGAPEHAEAQYSKHEISADGSRVVFTGPPLVNGKGAPKTWTWGGNIYMRIDDSETVQINVSERTAPDPRGPQAARFWGATPDDSKVFFTSDGLLTDDAENGPRSDPGFDHSNLYEYDLNAPQGKRLTLISVDSEPAQGPNETPNRALAMIGMSEDGSYVYFVGENRLVPGAPEPGSASLYAHQQLYVWHDGTVRFIANRDQAETKHAYGWGVEGIKLDHNVFRVTPDGKTIAFVSADGGTAKAAGVDIAGPHCTMPVSSTERHCFEVFAYNYGTGRMMCASCNPTGAVSDHDASFDLFADSFATQFEIPYRNRMLSNDGRYVFFSTEESLAPQDTNGYQDVYEFDTTTGQVHLISSGGCNCNSYFVDASASGRDVFFTTREHLVRIDFDANADLYDARVEGGIAAQNQAPPQPCEGDDCQGPAKAAPAFSLPASSTFNGVGNAPPASQTSSAKTKPKAKRHVKHKHRKRKKGRRSSAKRSSRRRGR